jgi:7-carboxy-7-deazaguanine synthase
MLQVNEIFLSIQGESSFSGLPCIFIRLAGCNLKCEWCDTPYHNENVQEMSFSEILACLKEFIDIDLVEVTGGEPLLQEETPALLQLLVDMGYTVLLETNGSLPIASLPGSVHNIVDVKCPSSGEAENFDRNNLIYLNPIGDELKFVIADRTDFEYARDFINFNNLWSYQILFSCVFNRLKPAELIAWTLKERLQVRFQLQIHKYIWDPKERER